MAFYFLKRESLAGGIRRVAGEQMQRAREELSAPDGRQKEAVHEARKRFKRIRAVLRLAKKPLGDAGEAENLVFRDLGRCLSAARDAEALLETLDVLAALRVDGVDAKALRSLRKSLCQRRDKIAGSESWYQAAMGEVLPQLEAAQSRVSEWTLDGDDFALIRRGLKRTYRQGRETMDRACASGVDADFHEWRKRVKDHWYHATLLRRTWPDYFTGYCRALSLLSDYLGDDHNLVVFRDTLAGEQLVEHAHFEPLLAAIARERQRLLEAAATLGRRVYAEKPAAFVERVEQYWEIWRAG